MPATTPNLGLTKDYEGEPYSLTRVNANSDRIDTFAGETNTAIAAKQDTLTAAQMNAANSGITAAKLTEDEAALANLIDSGAKNIVTVGFTDKTVYSVSFTNNGDGSITINGNSTNTSATIPIQDLVTGNSNALNTRYTLPSGTYHVVLDGGLGSDALLQVRAHNGTSDAALYGGTDGEFTYDSTTKEQYPYIAIRLYIKASAQFDNITVRPMICTAANYAISNAFVPYRPSWQEMYEMILALKGYHAINTISSSSQSPADIDDYKDTGFYIVTSASVATTIAHAPFTAAGFTLEVAPSYQVLGSTRGVIQTATSYVSGSTTTKKRWYLYGSGAWAWTEWETLGTGTRSASMLSMAAPETGEEEMR